MIVTLGFVAAGALCILGLLVVADMRRDGDPDELWDEFDRQ